MVPVTAAAESTEPEPAANGNGHKPHRYRDAVGQYLDAGWPAVLPLPEANKTPPPSGTTGHSAPMPTVDQHRQWWEDHPHGNAALRMPDGVIGLDVDN